ncbi:hypothetical protein LCGC14_1254410 [marine sediment metagenome]|uniref:Uncharacterized protein n=1 Tax=marine sediment metagenome TaxID=412755 RepID=A0A0F9P604_9ZZZZ
MSYYSPLSFARTSINRAIVADFTERYDDDTGWTLSANMTISSGVLNYTAVPRTPETSFKSLGLTLSDTLWYADWDYTETADTATDNFSWGVFCLCAGTGNPRTATQDAMMWRVVENHTDYRILITGRDGSTDTNSAQSSDILQSASKRFPRLKRTSSTGAAGQIFSDSARTSELVTGVTVTIDSLDAQSLTHIHHASDTTSNSETVTAEMDNSKVFNAVAP